MFYNHLSTHQDNHTKQGGTQNKLAVPVSF